MAKQLVEAEQPQAAMANDQLIQRDHRADVVIRTPNVLERLNRQHQVRPRPRERNDRPKTSDWFARVGLHTRVTLDRGDYFTIDVQSDTRYVTAYVVYSVTKLYPDLYNEGHPYVSIFSICAYATTLVYAQMLINDLHVRENPSQYSRLFRIEAEYRDFYDLLKGLRVPDFMKVIMDKMSAIIDPQRNGLQFVPCLASCLFKFDFGRLIPASLWYIVHDVLAATRQNQDPNVILGAVYRRNLVQYGNVHYTIAQILGGPYVDGQNPQMHPNWLNQIFEGAFNSAVGPYLVQRPTLARICFNEPVFQVNNFNAYAYVLSAHIDQLATTSTALEAISAFFELTEPQSRTIFEVQEEVTGISILSHSISPPTLPTWHGAGVVLGDAEPALVTDDQYAAFLNFMYQPPADEINLTYNQDDAQHVPATNPVKFMEFNRRRDVAPDVLYMQPYDKCIEFLDIAITLGHQIEVAELDAIAIPLPNPRNSLLETNSNFFAGSLPIKKIRPILPTGANGTSVPIIERVQEEELGFAPGINRSLLRERHHNHFGYNAHQEPPLENSVYLWSSYRHTTPNQIAGYTTTRFYASLRPMYGLATTMSSSPHPSILFPR